MKRLGVLAIVIILTLSLVACKDKDDSLPQKLRDLTLSQQFMETISDDDLLYIVRLANTTQVHPGNDIRKGFDSTAALSSDDLFNFFLNVFSEDESAMEACYQSSDQRYHIPVQTVNDYLNQYFTGYTFIPEQISAWDYYNQEENAFVQLGVLGFGMDGPNWTEISKIEVISEDIILIQAISYDRIEDENSDKVSVTFTLQLRITEDSYQFVSLLWEFPESEMSVPANDVSNNQYYPKYPITQDAAYLDEVTQKYIWMLAPYTGILKYSWPTPQDIEADNLVDICTAGNLLNIPRVDGYYTDQYPPAEQVESAIQRYFDVTAEHLRTSRWYNFVDEQTGEMRENTYVMAEGGGWGGAVALNTEQDGNILKITVGLYGPDDEPDRPYMTGLLTIRIDGENYQYLSYELA